MKVGRDVFADDHRILFRDRDSNGHRGALSYAVIEVRSGSQFFLQHEPSLAESGLWLYAKAGGNARRRATSPPPSASIPRRSSPSPPTHRADFAAGRRRGRAGRRRGPVAACTGMAPCEKPRATRGRQCGPVGRAWSTSRAVLPMTRHFRQTVGKRPSRPFPPAARDVAAVTTANAPPTCEGAPGGTFADAQVPAATIAGAACRLSPGSFDSPVEGPGPTRRGDGNLVHLGVRQSRLATFVDYRVSGAALGCCSRWRRRAR